jgi:D-3-phosphoglycerate dehydrogenase / 2-oxoglutarate reductase
VSGSGSARILITDCDHPTVDVERAIIEAAGLTLELGTCRTAQDVIAAASETDAIGLIVQYAPITGEVLRALPGCRVVGRYGVGLDTIDLATAASLSIAVVNVPDYCVDEVADHALGLMLALTRGIVPLDRGVQQGIWDFRLAGRVRRPSTQRVGIIGLGRIGAAFASRVRALGYGVVGTDPRGGGTSGVDLVELETLLETSDVVSIHAPLDGLTRHIIGVRALALMRPTAILINTSRGGLVDQDALVDALREGRLGGAALDVLEQEPIAPDHPLVGLPNVVLTPHAAFYSGESLVEMKRKVTERVLAVIAEGARGRPSGPLLEQSDPASRAP